MSLSALVMGAEQPQGQAIPDWQLVLLLAPVTCERLVAECCQRVEAAGGRARLQPTQVVLGSHLVHEAEPGGVCRGGGRLQPNTAHKHASPTRIERAITWAAHTTETDTLPYPTHPALLYVFIAFITTEEEIKGWSQAVRFLG